MTDELQIKQLIQVPLSRFGRIDIFVANAGLYVRCPVRDLSIRDIEQAMQGILMDWEGVER